VGYFTDAPEQAEFIQQFEQTSNPVLVFCEDRDDSFHGTVTRKDVYDWYKWWCEDTGHKPLSREKFIPKFRDILGDRILQDTRKRIDGINTRVFVFN
jgi:phage/plasmid-associated DNA primase